MLGKFFPAEYFGFLRGELLSPRRGVFPYRNLSRAPAGEGGASSSPPPYAMRGGAEIFHAFKKIFEHVFPAGAVIAAALCYTRLPQNIPRFQKIFAPVFPCSWGVKYSYSASCQKYSMQKKNFYAFQRQEKIENGQKK